MSIKWNEEKNELLKRTRGICFEQVVEAVAHDQYIGPENNPSREGQKRIVVKINDYPCVVPLVIEENGDWFLKTIYPSRKMKERI